MMVVLLVMVLVLVLVVMVMAIMQHDAVFFAITCSLFVVTGRRR